MEMISGILIAHRLTTVTGCDKIFVMKDGQIVEHGSHIQLLNEHGLYSEMWNEAV